MKRKNIMFLIFCFCLSLFASEAPTTPKKIDVIQAALELLQTVNDPVLQEVKQKVSSPSHVVIDMPEPVKQPDLTGLSTMLLSLMTTHTQGLKRQNSTDKELAEQEKAKVEFKGKVAIVSTATLGVLTTLLVKYISPCDK